MSRGMIENVNYLKEVALSILDSITQQTETEFDGVKKSGARIGAHIR